MLLTTPLLAKSSFFGSLINKCRPAASASISINSASCAAAPGKSLEEKVGLPPRPKKPLTPYFRYMQDLRPKMLAENPKMPLTETVRIISKRWKDVEPKTKERLLQEYKRDQEKYVERRAIYDSKITEQQLVDMKKLKQEIEEAKDRRMLRQRIKELGRPKKPASAFLRYVSKERTATPQLPSESYRDWHKKCTAKWTRLDDKDKAIYMQEARKELDQYKIDIIAWEDKMIRQGNIDVVRHGNLIDPPEPKAKKSATPQS